MWSDQGQGHNMTLNLSTQQQTIKHKSTPIIKYGTQNMILTFDLGDQGSHEPIHLNHEIIQTISRRL